MEKLRETTMFAAPPPKQEFRSSDQGSLTPREAMSSEDHYSEGGRKWDFRRDSSRKATEMASVMLL